MTVEVTEMFLKAIRETAVKLAGSGTMEIAEVPKHFVTFDEKIPDGAVLITAIPIAGGSAKVYTGQ